MVTSLVHFEVGSTYTVPLQLAFVPTLFFLPAALVPLCVVAAFLLVKLPEVLSGRKPVGRLLPAVGDSWFAIGPALVFAVAAPGQPDGHDWAVYLLALGAHLAGYDVLLAATAVLALATAALVAPRPGTAPEAGTVPTPGYAGACERTYSM